MIAAPLRFHWYESEPLPLAATLKRAELPSTIVWGAGWPMIVGGVAPPPGAGTAMTPGLPPPLPQAVNKTTLNRSPIFLAVAQKFMMPPPSGASRRDALLLAEPWRGTWDRRKSDGFRITRGHRCTARARTCGSGRRSSVKVRIYGALALNAAIALPARWRAA